MLTIIMAYKNLTFWINK